jgi:hypothetical protein
MTPSSLRTADGRTAFEPGEKIQVVAEWACDQPLERAEVRLVWYTRGKGDTDHAVVRRERLDAPRASDSRTVELQLPEAPYSFSGDLVSLVWAVRLDLFGAAKPKQIEIVVAPLAREVVLNVEESNGDDDEDGDEDDLFDGSER